MGKRVLHHIRKGPSVSGEPTDTRQWDNVARMLWADHGVMAVHMQDKRLSEHERVLFTMLCNKLYGGRV